MTCFCMTSPKVSIAWTSLVHHAKVADEDKRLQKINEE